MNPGTPAGSRRGRLRSVRAGVRRAREDGKADAPIDFSPARTDGTGGRAHDPRPGSRERRERMKADRRRPEGAAPGISRRQFVKTGGGGRRRPGLDRPAGAGGPVAGARPGGDRLRKRQPLHERRRRSRRRTGVPADDRGHGHPGEPDRGGEHRGARSRGRERRLRGTPQRRWRGPARFLLHARPPPARRRRGGHRGGAHALPGGAPGAPDSRSPITTCWWARARRPSPGTWVSRSRTI